MKEHISKRAEAELQPVADLDLPIEAVFCPNHLAQRAEGHAAPGDEVEYGQGIVGSEEQTFRHLGVLAKMQDFQARFGNTFEMLKAWGAIFTDAERRPTEQPADDLLLGEALQRATLDTPLAQLGLGTRALNALERAGVVDVRGLLQLPPLAVNSMRGVGASRRITA